MKTLSEQEKAKIIKLIPSIVNRGRNGDQNALAILTQVNKKRRSNPRAAFSHFAVTEFIKKFPPNSLFHGEYEIDYELVNGIFRDCGPLAAAIMISDYPSVNFQHIRGDWKLVRLYTLKLKACRNGDLNKLSPVLAWELGD